MTLFGHGLIWHYDDNNDGVKVGVAFWTPSSGDPVVIVPIVLHIGGSRGGAPGARPPTGPDSFILICKIFET